MRPGVTCAMRLSRLQFDWVSHFSGAGGADASLKAEPAAGTFVDLLGICVCMYV